jgi:phosphinothricin acetyltransferase
MGGLRRMTPDDWEAVAAIYEEGLASGVATFETEVPSWEAWDGRHLPAPRLVFESDGAVVGWVAATPVSTRECYRGVVEHSVYVAAVARGAGVGTALLNGLVEAAPGHGIWTIQTSVMAGNEPSLRLHRRAGFREVGRRERIARRDGRWHDTVLLELRLP